MIPRFVKGAAVGTSLILVAVLGLTVGRTVGSIHSADEPAAFRTGLQVGTPLPRVTLEDASGDTLLTDALVRGTGCVFLFIDPNCPSCEPASRRWQQLLDEGELGEESVIGVCSRSFEEIERYRLERGFSFPILRDLRDEFRRRYDVVGLPYEVVVGRSGIIRTASAKTHAPIEVKDLLKNLGR